MGGYLAACCLAVSRDGIRWEKPSFDVRPGTNEVLSHRNAENRYGVSEDFTLFRILPLPSRSNVHWSGHP